MELPRGSLQSPVAMIVLVALVTLVGIMSLLSLPVQLFPDMHRPEISILTRWRAASPEEVESEILVPLETVLQGLPGVEELDGSADTAEAFINIRFAMDTDMKAELLEVLARLNRLKPLPQDADRPVVSLSGSGVNETLSWFFVQLLPGKPGPIWQYKQYIEDTVRPRLEAVPGVGSVNIVSGPPDDVRVSVDLARAAQLRISLTDIQSAAASANNVSGGQLDVGRRQFTLRFMGRYRPEDLGAMVLAWREGRPIHLADVASIEVAPQPRERFAYQNNNPAISVQVLRADGANVLATLDAVKAAVAELRSGPLRSHGFDIEQSFDSSLFIRRAIHFLSENLVLGMVLALLIVWWFIRDGRTTALIAATIPVCLCATFIVLALVGRSVNVISLAGLSFAVGMVVEGSIVVSGNIVRMRETGLSLPLAVREGSRQVAGALIASTATTIVVFVPVLFIKDIEGQLFGDLALTISVAVAISIVVALGILPGAAAVVLARPSLRSGYGQGWPKFSAWVLKVTDNTAQQVGWIVGLLIAPLALAWWMLPTLDYLPPVKRAAIDVSFAFPPGMSSEAVNREIVPLLIERMKPYMGGVAEPRLKNYYILTWPGGGTIGARVMDESRINEFQALLRTELLRGIPDTRTFVTEGDLFSGIGGSSRSSGIHLQTEDIEALGKAASHGRMLLEAQFPGAAVRVYPNPDVQVPELHATPDDRRIAEVGWDRSTVGMVVRTVGDGAWLGEYFNGNARLPVVMRANTNTQPEALAAAPLYTRSGQVVQLGDLVQFSIVSAPTALSRIDHRRTITLTVDPPESVSLEQALDAIHDRILPTLEAELPPGSTIRMAGSAADLSRALSTMGRVFALAVGVLFMVMTVLFQSTRDSLIVLLAIPLSLIGGVLGLRILGMFSFQPLDLLSMIGFIMMLGVVVNHSILLVAAVRGAQRSGASLEEAIRAGLDQRLRAIVASTLTGALGLLPMAANPGPGSTIYRGLAAVNIGGVVVTLAFSLLLIPALLRLLDVRRLASVPRHTTASDAACS